MVCFVGITIRGEYIRLKMSLRALENIFKATAHTSAIQSEQHQSITNEMDPSKLMNDYIFEFLTAPSRNGTYVT